MISVKIRSKTNFKRVKKKVEAGASGPLTKRRWNRLLRPIEACVGYHEGLDLDLGILDRPRALLNHAERDSIYYAANRGVSLKGAIMVCPWAACCDCARAIIGSGISALVYHRQRYLLTDKRWIDSVNATNSGSTSAKISARRSGWVRTSFSTSSIDVPSVWRISRISTQ